MILSPSRLFRNWESCAEGEPLTCHGLPICAGGELSDGHAPEALKPLLQPDSPLARLYEVCDACETLSTTASAANQVGLKRCRGRW